MKLIKPIFIIVTIVSSFSLLSQDIQISGTVEEESSGEAIPNISIVWEGSSGKKFSPYGNARKADNAGSGRRRPSGGNSNRGSGRSRSK